MPKNITQAHLKTIGIRVGEDRTHHAEHSEPIILSSSFVFKNASEAAARFKGDSQGNIYTRFTNPTVAMFEKRLAAMEQGERCIATSSGMSAIFCTVLGLLCQGQHIVASRSIFGTTVRLFEEILPKYGITTTFVGLTDYMAWEKAIHADTALLFLETPSNPLTEIVDIKRLGQIAHQHDKLLVVDNCFCTPVLQQPIPLGADIVIHSATKYLDGQGRCLGGAIISTFDLIEEHIYSLLRTTGFSMSPFNAWVFLKGLETLAIRMQAHSQHAIIIAKWLEQHDRVKCVHYPGLSSHPQHQLAVQQQKDFGGVISFELEGGQVAAWKMIDSVALFSITANLGDTKSTITHPATTTHHRLSPDQRLAAGITDGLIRLSIGLEDSDDLIADLDQALYKTSTISS